MILSFFEIRKWFGGGFFQTIPFFNKKIKFLPKGTPVDMANSLSIPSLLSAHYLLIHKHNCSVRSRSKRTEFTDIKTIPNFFINFLLIFYIQTNSQNLFPSLLTTSNYLLFKSFYSNTLPISNYLIYFYFII